MKVSKAVTYCFEYHRTNSKKKNSIRPYEFVLSRFDSQFHDRELASITSGEILSFLNQITEGSKQSTRRSRYSCLASFFNFIKNVVDPKLQNLCSTPMLRKLFRPAKIAHWTILEKEVVDEIIFRTTNPRNRLMLELMARGGINLYLGEAFLPRQSRLGSRSHSKFETTESMIRANFVSISGVPKIPLSKSVN